MTTKQKKAATTTAVAHAEPGDALTTNPFGVERAVEHEAGVAARVAQEESEIKAAIILARQFPRDEAAAYTRLTRSCERFGFADGAAYSFPRGGKTVTGPSVRLAREIARCWGNLQYGLRIVEMTNEHVHVKGWAWDVETNLRAESEAKFGRLIPRKDKQTGETHWLEPNERDLRELINRHGAIAVRNALLQVVPPDVIEDALVMSRRTVEKAARGELKQDREKLVRSTVASFAYYGVNEDMLERFIGNPMSQISEQQVASLREVYAALKDGAASVADVFGTSDTDAVRSAAVNELQAIINDATHAQDDAQDDA